jgi:pheromone a factor receptor
VILVALPLVSALMIYYILVARDAWPKPYNFNATHFGPDPFNIYFISFTTSDMMNWQDLSTDYIGLLAGIFLFVPFGTTAEALNMYRKILLAIGLGYIFPKLKNVYHPTLKRRSRSRWWSSVAQSVRGKSLLASRYDPPPFPLSLASY